MLKLSAWTTHRLTHSSAKLKPEQEKEEMRHCLTTNTTHREEKQYSLLWFYMNNKTILPHTIIWSTPILEQWQETLFALWFFLGPKMWFCPSEYLAPFLMLQWQALENRHFRKWTPWTRMLALVPEDQSFPRSHVFPSTNVFTGETAEHLLLSVIYPKK